MSLRTVNGRTICVSPWAHSPHPGPRTAPAGRWRQEGCTAALLPPATDITAPCLSLNLTPLLVLASPVPCMTEGIVEAKKKKKKRSSSRFGFPYRLVALPSICQTKVRVTGEMGSSGSFKEILGRGIGGAQGRAALRAQQGACFVSKSLKKGPQL